MASTHGLTTRGLEAGALPGLGYGRYGNLFDAPPATRLPQDLLARIADAMIKSDLSKPITEAETVDENPTIPAGYTYFGQFIDHDLTFDPTPLNAATVDIAAMEDFRSPALDLDSVYGRGPDDQPYLYSDGLQLRLGQQVNPPQGVRTTRDLFRIVDDIPLLGDKRNDENKIVSQIHSTIISFHNKVVTDRALITRAAGADAWNDPVRRFRAAVDIVRWHYQWVVVHDYLERVTEPGTVAEVLNAGGVPRLHNYAKAAARYAYMPVEFSGAAFRFGHSMVRPGYALNIDVPDGPDAPRIPTFVPRQAGQPNEPPFVSLNGFPGPLVKNWGIDWGYFLDVPAKAQAGYQVPQPSYRIDALLVGPLSDLPEFKGLDRLVRNLAFRNLLRGQELGLPSGQEASRRLGILPLPDSEIWSAGSRLRNDHPPASDDAKELQTTAKQRRAVWDASGGEDGPLAGNTPLWFYILREAEHYGVSRAPDEEGVAFGGQHLGPVGSRIVAETLIGLLWYDHSSFLKCRPAFRPFPEIAGRDGTLTLGRLFTYALSPAP